MKSPFLTALVCSILLAVAGCNNNDGAPSGVSGLDPTNPNLGEKVYTQRCAACHERGLAGAPQIGNPEEWRDAIARGIDKMVEHSLVGFRGSRGFMPARGGHPDLSDAEVSAAVNYLVRQSK